MTVNELENIKSLIQKAEVRSAKAQGQIDSIEAKWESEYSVKTIEQAKEKLAEIQEELAQLEEREAKLSSNLLSVTDWDKLEGLLG
jgi:predicted  nucleic acid-binding Zn-ribbon protein